MANPTTPTPSNAKIAKHWLRITCMVLIALVGIYLIIHSFIGQPGSQRRYLGTGEISTVNNILNTVKNKDTAKENIILYLTDL